MTQTNSGTPVGCPAVNAFGRMYADQALFLRRLRMNRNQPNIPQPASMEAILCGCTIVLKLSCSKNWQAIQFMPRLNAKKSGTKIRNLIIWLRGMFMFFIVKTPFFTYIFCSGVFPLLCFHYSTKSITKVLQILCHTFWQKSPETAHCTKSRSEITGKVRLFGAKSGKFAKIFVQSYKSDFFKKTFFGRKTPPYRV